MAKLLDAQPHFVRCIRPNGEKRGGFFQHELVKDQLKYTGVLETVKIRRQGYATRLPHNVFIDRCLTQLHKRVLIGDDVKTLTKP